MAQLTSIEWTDGTWNPFVGCSPVSAGCKNCYAARMASRQELMGRPAYQGTTGRDVQRPRWTGVVNRNSNAAFLGALKFAPGSRVFVNSMSDFFHVNAPLDAQRDVMALIDSRPGVQFQILTKRPERYAGVRAALGLKSWPANVWLGATVEDGRVRERIGLLAAEPCAGPRFLSVEPMTARLGAADFRGIGWIITGGESGPGRRPCRPEWVREVRDQALRDGAAYFHKQWGHWRDNPALAAAIAAGDVQRRDADARAWLAAHDPHGKGGAILDGRLWREFPSHAASSTNA